MSPLWISSNKLSPFYRTVCLQNRCAESLWTIDLGYRIVPTNHQVNTFLERKKVPHPYWSMVEGRVAAEAREFDTGPVWFTSGPHRRTHSSRDRGVFERNSDHDDYDDLTVTNSPADFWQRFTERDYESQDPSSGMSLFLTLIFYLALFGRFINGRKRTGVQDRRGGGPISPATAYDVITEHIALQLPLSLQYSFGCSFALLGLWLLIKCNQVKSWNSRHFLLDQSFLVRFAALHSAR
ncbi:hypothetical protein J6590_036354 [Homalodisca vitripennis]|nr:hypothetical protein J6590_036354 [Homalodisca vitripennis]